LDTNFLIYYIEDHADFGQTCQDLIDVAVRNNAKLVTSGVSLAEIVAHPFKKNKPDLAEQYRNLLMSPPLAMVDLTSEICYLAGKIRGEKNLKLPDALQVAAGISSSCSAFVTNDKDLNPPDEISRILLSEIQARQ
jgi:predicted nucleic acid-binding protein